MSITRSKPFYAVAGVTDAAVKSLREVPAKLPTVRIERKDVEKAVEKAVANLQAETVAFPQGAVDRGRPGRRRRGPRGLRLHRPGRARPFGRHPDPSPEGQPGPLGARPRRPCGVPRRPPRLRRTAPARPRGPRRRRRPAPSPPPPRSRHRAEHRQVGHHGGPQDGRVGRPRDHRRRRQARPLTTTVAAPLAPARPSRRRPHLAGGGATRLCPVAGDGAQAGTAVNIQQP